MSLAILLTVAFGTIYIGYGMFIGDYKKELRTILSQGTVLVIITIWAIYILTFLGGYSKLDLFFYPIFIVIALFTIYKIYLLSIKKPLEVVAKQTSYWGVNAKDIYKKYDWKLDFRKDRIEIRTNRLKKEIYRTYSNDEKYITGNIFLAMNDLKFTKVDDLSEIKSELYLALIKKFKEIILELELKNDLDTLLKENDNCVEFFLINCWEIYTERVNLGIATLDILAKNFTEYELLGALDNATLNSVKRHGAAMYFKYAEFKNLLPKDIIEKRKEEDKYQIINLLMYSEYFYSEFKEQENLKYYKDVLGEKE